VDDEHTVCRIGGRGDSGETPSADHEAERPEAPLGIAVTSTRLGPEGSERVRIGQ
jgi:hypothetical protein